jgi:23S rRNA (cytidine1920-2'-O)/16S rRNA (cytidine1409-2'-O)-methyltransferase
MILAGEVVVGDRRQDKPGTLVVASCELRLKAGATLRYASRGGLKLEAALQRFAVDVAGLTGADLGASTGGFTDCLLQHGAARVHACDVGYGQLDSRLAGDPRVVVHDRLNVRAITSADLGEQVQLCTIDVSFISLRLVLGAARGLLRPRGWLICLIKPQFEVGAKQIAKGGVVKDPVARAAAIAGIVAFAQGLGFEIVGTMDSPVHGPAGNVEALMVGRLAEV